MKRTNLIVRTLVMLLKFLLAAFLLVIGYGTVLAIIELSPQLWQSLTPRHSFLLGTAIFLPLYLIFRRRFAVWGTMEHELTHALTALLFLRRVRSISAGEKHGETEFSGRGSALITLTPYFLPTLALLPLALRPLLAPAYQSWVDLLLGSLFLYYLISNLRESHPAQPDLHRHGLLFSYCVILPLNLLLLSLLLLMGSGNEQLLSQFLNGVLEPLPQLLDFVRAQVPILTAPTAGAGGV